MPTRSSKVKYSDHPEPMKESPFGAPVADDTTASQWKLLTLVLLLSTSALCVAVIVESVAVSSLVNKSLIQVPTAVNSEAAQNALENVASEGGAGVAFNRSVFASKKPPAGDNPCEGKDPKKPNIDCAVSQVVLTKEQAAANVTKGFQGELITQAVPLLVPFFQAGLCPVNVHWHIGTEHLSVGEYDENGTGPSDVHERRRRLSGDGVNERKGFLCHLYDENDPKFTAPYDWQHCEEMEVGQTYEVHWPQSVAGACGTPNQYQTPFIDGVFCQDYRIADTATEIGVQAQVFTVVNDESFYYPDLMRGMIVDGDLGQDLAMYTGSTTGTTVNNEVCSPYSPITWQVDRKCHLISASTFDKMCADMKAQRDDMSADMRPHGSRELVDKRFAANNQHARYLRA